MFYDAEFKGVIWWSFKGFWVKTVQKLKQRTFCKMILEHWEKVSSDFPVSSDFSKIIAKNLKKLAHFLSGYNPFLFCHPQQKTFSFYSFGKPRSQSNFIQNWTVYIVRCYRIFPESSALSYLLSSLGMQLENDKTHFSMLYILIQHGFLTNHSALRF